MTVATDRDRPRPTATDRDRPRPTATDRDRVEQVEGSVAPVAHDDQRAVWEPAIHQTNQLTRPARDRLVAPTMRLGVAFRGSKRTQERQCPDTPSPGNRDQQHEADPA